jgi:formate C-acetyltransferase
MQAQPASSIDHGLKQPHGLSPRVQWLRDYYFEGVKRSWNNQFTCWTTGAPWDVLYDEITYYVVPEVYAFMPVFRPSALQAAQTIELHRDFWKWSLPERRAWFIREVMVDYVPPASTFSPRVAGRRPRPGSGTGGSKDRAEPARR